MVWTLKRIRLLRKESEDALARIQRLVDNTALEKPHSGHFAWGQFLDAPRNVEQFGLFGTAAAIRILVKAGSAQGNPKIRNSRSWLPEIEPSANNWRQDETDLGLTIKCAYVLSAAEMGEEGEYVRRETMEDRLRATVIEGKGWGDYSHLAAPDTTPRIMPTCHALLALQGSRDFRTSKETLTILGWLSDALVRRTDLRPHELAMAALALQAYPGEGVHVPEYQEALGTATHRLTRWAKTRKREPGAHVWSHHYTAPTSPDGSQHTHYMFYLPDVLIARFFLRLPEVPKEVRSYILRIVRMVAANVVENGGFKSASTHQIATLDQLEVMELLQLFSSRASEPAQLLPRLMGTLGASRVGRVYTSISLLMVSCLSLVPPVADVGSTSLQVVGTVVATLTAGILATLWVSWAGAK